MEEKELLRFIIQVLLSFTINVVFMISPSFAIENAIDKDLEEIISNAKKVFDRKEELSSFTLNPNYDNVKTDFNNTGKEEKYLFISFSIPKTALLDLINGAKESGFIPVLRGFKNDQYNDTVKELQDIIKETQYGVVIDPNLFTQFEINLVPTYVVAQKNKNCPSHVTCPDYEFVKISGNIANSFAQGEFKKRGLLE
jgi:type-F conjugative transfer system pilin assembly protein TrbC